MSKVEFVAVMLVKAVTLQSRRDKSGPMPPTVVSPATRRHYPSTTPKVPLLCRRLQTPRLQDP